MTTEPIFKWTNSVLSDQYAMLLPTLNPLEHLREVLKPHRCIVKLHKNEFIFEGTYQRMLRVHVVLSEYFHNLKHTLISDDIITFSPSSIDNVVEIESSDVTHLGANVSDEEMDRPPVSPTSNEQTIPILLDSSPDRDIDLLYVNKENEIEDDGLDLNNHIEDIIYVDIMMYPPALEGEAVKSSDIGIDLLEIDSISEVVENVNNERKTAKNVDDKDNLKTLVLDTKSKPKLKTNYSTRNYEGSKPFKFFCGKCSFKSKRESAFVIHEARHCKGESLFSCKACNFVTITKSTLLRHNIREHRSGTVSCDICAFSTNRVQNMRKHMQRKHIISRKKKRVVLSCDLCDYVTDKSHLMIRHKQLHLGKENSEKSFKCHSCGYRTMVKSRFNSHVRSHCNTRPYLCATCGKSFKRSDTLSKHELLHVPPSKQFTCRVCSKSNHSQYQLQVHMRTVHVNTRSFLCEVCGASFKTIACQRTHMRTIHMHPRAFSCNDCSRKFNTKYTLTRHIKMHRLERKAARKLTENAALRVYTAAQSSQIPIHLIPTNTILIQDSSQQQHDSLASITISESQLGEHTLSVLTPAEPDTSFITQSETAAAPALFYLRNYSSF